MRGTIFTLCSRIATTRVTRVVVVAPPLCAPGAQSRGAGGACGPAVGTGAPAIPQNVGHDSCLHIFAAMVDCPPPLGAAVCESDG